MPWYIRIYPNVATLHAQRDCNVIDYLGSTKYCQKETKSGKCHYVKGTSSSLWANRLCGRAWQPHVLLLSLMVVYWATIYFDLSRLFGNTILFQFWFLSTIKLGENEGDEIPQRRPVEGSAAADVTSRQKPNTVTFKGARAHVIPLVPESLTRLCYIRIERISIKSRWNKHQREVKLQGQGKWW